MAKYRFERLFPNSLKIKTCKMLFFKNLNIGDLVYIRTYYNPIWPKNRSFRDFLDPHLRDRLTKKANLPVASTFFLRHNSFSFDKKYLRPIEDSFVVISKEAFYIEETLLDSGCWPKWMSCGNRWKRKKQKEKKRREK